MNDLSTKLHIYGMEHGYWKDYSEFFTRSKHDREMVAGIMAEEIIGIHPVENTMLSISELEDFAEAKRNEYINLNN
jgi:hypothetical protein